MENLQNGATYAGALKGAGPYVDAGNNNKTGGARPKVPNTAQPAAHSSPPVVFFKNRDAVPYSEHADWSENNLKNEEVYIQLTKTIRQEYIEGVQRIGGLWRLYIVNAAARCKLMAEGLNIRGKNVTVHQNNPFLRTANTVTVRVCDVPLSVHDSEILSQLRFLGADVVGECIREKLRVGGQLVNCYTGNRRIQIKTPKEPLPRYVAVNDFIAKLYHQGQPQTQDVTCSNCLERGHYMATCKKPQKCKECGKEGHSQMICPARRARLDSEIQEKTQNEQREAERNELEQAEINETPAMPTVVKKPREQGVLKLRAGKIEITRRPDSDRDSSVGHKKSDSDHADTEYFSNNESSDQEFTSAEHSDGQYSIQCRLSVKTP